MSDSPNIVLVTMDTARACSFSCYGNGRNTTSFLDGLAEEGVLYENAVSQENWTMPAHGSIFSGEYVSDHRVTKSKSYSSIDSFTEELSGKGYRTVGITNIPYVSSEFDADDLFEEFEDLDARRSFFEGLDISREEFYSQGVFSGYLDLLRELIVDRRVDKVFSGAERFFERKLNLTDSRARMTNRKVKEKLSEEDERPFFLFLNYIEPHAPYMPPFPYSHKYLDGFPSFSSLRAIDHGELKQKMEPGEEPDQRLLDIHKNLYEAEINYLDSKLEEMYEWISERYPNTVFIFTSDHGEQFYEKGLIGHSQSLYSEVVDVPLIEDFPGEVSENISEPVEARMLHDHVLELAEGKIEPMSAAEYAVSEDIGSEETEVDSEFREDKGYYGVSVQDEEHKLIWYSSGDKELRRVSTSEEIENREKVEELSKVIVERVGDPEENDYRKWDMEVEDEEIKERLKKLGYN